jgi:hypothetical protein
MTVAGGRGGDRFNARWGSALVVVLHVLGQNMAKMSLPEDEHPVGELTAQRSDPPLGEGVGPRTPRRCPDHVDAGAGEDRIKDGGELAAAVTDEESEPVRVVTEVHQEIAGRLCGPGPVGVWSSRGIE